MLNPAGMVTILEAVSKAAGQKRGEECITLEIPMGEDGQPLPLPVRILVETPYAKVTGLVMPLVTVGA